KARAGDRDNRFWRLNIDGDGGEAGTVFKETLATLQLLDVSSDVSNLSLHFECVSDFVCLAHDFQKLLLECFLSLDTCFEIDELFGDVLTAHIFLRCVAGQFLDLVKRDAKLSRGNSDHQLDVECALRR